MSVERPEFWIPKYLQESGGIVHGFSLYDIAFVLGVTIAPPAALVYLPNIPYVPQIPFVVTFPALVAGIILGGVIFWTTPEDYSTLEWTSANVRHVMMQNHITHISRGSGSEESEQKDLPSRDKVRVWEASRRTQDLTFVDRVHVDDHVIERLDGAFVGGLKVSGVNLSLASQDVKQRTVGQLAAFLNDNEHQIQIYVTTEPFDFDEHVQHYNDRQNDRDIQERPILEELLFSYRASTLKATGAHGTNTRRYYILVGVEASEIAAKDRDVDWKERLSKLPVFKRFVSVETPSEEEAHAEHVDEVHRRLQLVKEGLAGVEGLHTAELTANELAVLQAEFWTGRDHAVRGGGEAGDSSLSPIGEGDIVKLNTPASDTE